jgi:hypothetical protein
MKVKGYIYPQMKKPVGMLYNGKNKLHFDEMLTMSALYYEQTFHSASSDTTDHR